MSLRLGMAGAFSVLLSYFRKYARGGMLIYLRSCRPKPERFRIEFAKLFSKASYSKRRVVRAPGLTLRLGGAGAFIALLSRV